MDRLMTEFRQRLVERIEALTSARPALIRDPAARTLVRDIAHALKGSGGTYGFPEISGAAAAVEQAAADALGDRVDALVAALRRAAAPVGATATAPPADDTGRGRLAALPVARRGDAPPQSTNPNRLLIVDDDPDITRLLGQALAAPDREIVIAASAAAAERTLAEQTVALIVLDLMLPDADGRRVLARLREDPHTAVVPIIVLSAHAADATRAECFALGADAYIPKPFDLATVLTTVASKLERAASFTQDARLDPVSALPNRVAFHEAFEHATARREDRRTAISVALLELDQYRALAMTSGWGTADRARAAAAAPLAHALGRAAIVAHWAGATFVALMVGADVADATALVTEALRTLQETPSQDRSGTRFTFSAGVVEWTEGTTLEDTVAEAERHVVAARATGGNTTLSSSRPGTGSARVIALVEDDDLIVSVVKHRLEREGMTVRHFTDGASARDALPRLHPALAILDVKLPGMDGFELLGRLRAEPALAGLPIMMLTSMGNEQDVVRGLQLGADDYVVKPFSPVELVARVHRLLIRR